MSRKIAAAVVVVALGASLWADVPKHVRQVSKSDPCSYVNPFVGTAGFGHTTPAACVPFGMIQAGPDTGNGDWDHCSGYNHCDKAAARIREVFDRFYLPKTDGLCGNDDCGQMSAWYIFSALGFYPFNPCGGTYVLGAPQIPKATVSLPGGKALTVVARNLSKENKFVRSATLNGKALDKTIEHADLMKGGEIVFEMSGSPSHSITL